MLPFRDDFLDANIEGLAICGVHVINHAVHVGLYYDSEGEKKIIHFLTGDDIQITDASDGEFTNYFFNPLPDFPKHLIPTLSAIADLVSLNKLHNFEFNRVGVVYDGGKFDFQTGLFQMKSGAEKFVNCGVFVIAFLKTFDYVLIDWNSWPNAAAANRTFLEEWLNDNNIAAEDRDTYYSMTKEVRGKHVIVSPLTQTIPSPFIEVQTLSNELINFLTA